MSTRQVEDAQPILDIPVMVREDDGGDVCRCSID
jgi:hypothetical protein